MTDTKPKTPTHVVNGLRVAPSAADLKTLAAYGVQVEPIHDPDLTGTKLRAQEDRRAAAELKALEEVDKR